MPVLHEAAVGLRVDDRVAAEEADAEAAQPQQERRDDARPFEQLDERTAVSRSKATAAATGERRHDECGLARPEEQDASGPPEATAILGDALGVIGRAPARRTLARAPGGA